MLKDLLFVGLGGGMGSMLRFLTSRLSSRFISSDWALVGTFLSNIAGCFFIGLFIGWLLPNAVKTQTLSLLFITGFCGGYTTFSAFAFENVQLWQSGYSFLSVVYILSSVIFGMLAVLGGLKLS